MYACCCRRVIQLANACRRTLFCHLLLARLTERRGISGSSVLSGSKVGTSGAVGRDSIFEWKTERRVIRSNNATDGRSGARGKPCRAALATQPSSASCRSGRSSSATSPTSSLQSHCRTICSNGTLPFGVTALLFAVCLFVGCFFVWLLD